ncbi:MAG: 2-C-methyl-D-erythritol 4-phosphate cytidylyltransferase [Terrimicrobiaceae bacterium]|nr:2-C-methyl-D-erythritol 4-phosphate cytidylyltransferase [Terrimicrobiaceae bacterium]
MADFDAVVVAAGASRMVGFDKILARIEGRTVLEWSLAAFAQTPGLAALVVVCPAGRIEEFRGVCAGIPQVSAVVAGGSERVDSVRAGLAAIEDPRADTLVAVHDAARPLVLPAAIAACVEEARRMGAAALAAPCEDTLHEAGAEGFVVSSPSREKFWRAQTPQVARRGDLLRALGAGRFTDEASALASLGLRVRLVENAEPNFKITRPADLAMAAAVLAGRRPAQ